MIFNITSGGIAYIRVEAPTGATVTATQGGMSFSRTGSGDITVTSIGDWDVYCVYNNVRATTEHTSLSAFGATSQTVSFNSYYTATIRVTTQPGATCSAKLGTLTIPSKQANSNGICDLTVPAGGLGTWEVTADNGVYTGDLKKKSVYVGSYGSTATISILTEIPVISMTINGASYTYKGTTINDSNVTVYQSGNGFKMWIRKSGTVKFTYLNGAVNVCAVGRGGAGGRYSHPSNNTDQGGGGGGGGGVVTANASLTLNSNYTVTIGDSSSFGSLAVAGRGGSASGITGGSSGGNSGAGGNGAQAVDTGWNGISYGGRGDGGNGVYAFGNSSFDGVVYAHGGQGGDVGYGTGKMGDTTGVYANPGAGGAGGGSGNNNPTSGNYGLVMLWKT